MTTIDRLNDDVLLEIFSYLSGSDLKNCTTVCKSWLEVIISSASTMKKLPLWLEKGWDEKQPLLGTVKRNFHSVHAFLTIHKDEQLLYSLLSRDTIRHLELEEVKITRKHFSQLVLGLPNLDELVIDDSWIVKDGPEWEGRRISKNVLEKLAVKTHEWEFLTLITKMEISVRELKLFSPSKVTVDNLKHLKTFFTSQRLLKTLALDITCPVLEVLVTIDKCYELESLYVCHRQSRDDNPEAALVEFLERHRESLNNLELVMNLSKETLEHIVKTLKIKRLMIPRIRDIEHLARVCPNKFLKKLVVTGELQILDSLKWLLRNYCDLEILIIKEWNSDFAAEFLDFICDHMKSLRHLELPIMRCNSENPSTQSHQPSSLKSLRVENVPSYEAITALYTRIISIETLSIKWLPKNATYDDLVFLTARFPELKHLKLGAKFEANERLLETFHRISPKLREIEICGVSPNIQANLTFGSLQVFNYTPSSSNHVFPFEKTLWQDDDDDGEGSSGSGSSSGSSAMSVSDSDTDDDDNFFFDDDMDYVQDVDGQGEFGFLHMFR